MVSGEKNWDWGSRLKRLLDAPARPCGSQREDSDVDREWYELQAKDNYSRNSACEANTQSRHYGLLVDSLACLH